VVGRVFAGLMSRLSLREVLSGRPAGALRYAVEHALTSPWCWPRDASMREAARSYGTAVPTGPAVGEVLLVSVSAEEPREALWRLAWRRRRGDRGAPFGDRAQESLQRVAQLASGVVPHLHSVTPTRELPTVASLICKRGEGGDRQLDDRSYELSMLLAVASRLMERPVPGHFAASATIGAGGAPGRVEGLDRKLSMLAENALAIETVLVAKEQEAWANELIQKHGWPIRAVGVETCEEAVDLVFSTAREAAPPHWDDAAVRGGVVESLIDLCRAGASVLDWRAVARTGEWLQRETLEPRQRARVEVATLIARRHANHSSIEIPWNDRLCQRDLVMAAHMVQAAADAGSDSLESYLQRADALAEDADDDDGHRQLRGAVGRARATMRQYPAALTVLSATTQRWFDSGKIGSSSHALSEWLRVAAIADDAAAWAHAVERAEQYLAAERSSEDVGPWYVRFALGRALIVQGSAREGVATLDAVDFDAMPKWLKRTWMRWQARGRVALSGHDEQVTSLRARVAEEDAEEVPMEALFVALDEVIEHGRDPGAAIAAIRAANPQGARWLFDEALSPVEQARRLAVEYPY